MCFRFGIWASNVVLRNRFGKYAAARDHFFFVIQSLVLFHKTSVGWRAWMSVLSFNTDAGEDSASGTFSFFLFSLIRVIILFVRSFWRFEHGFKCVRSVQVQDERLENFRRVGGQCRVRARDCRPASTSRHSVRRKLRHGNREKRCAARGARSRAAMRMRKGPCLLRSQRPCPSVRCREFIVFF